MADVKWIKIVVDVFSDEKIRLIEEYEMADSIIVIWFKLLCLAGKSNNNGFVTLTDELAYTDEMLSTIFNRDIEFINMSLEIFVTYGMIEIEENTILIANWSKHQSADKMAEMRIKNKERQAKFREKKTGNGDVPPKPKKPSFDYDALLEYWNSKEIIQHGRLTDNAKKEIKKKMSDFTLEEMKLAIDHYSEMLKSSYEYCNYKWSIEIFFKRSEGINQFMDDGSKWLNYTEKFKGKGLAGTKNKIEKAPVGFGVVNNE